MNTVEIKKIITGGQGLPGLPQAVLQVLRCQPGDIHTLRESVALATVDPGMRNRILLEAEAAAEGAPVRDINEAIDRLGLAGVRGAVFRHMAMALFPPEESHRLDRETFWRHSFVCAAFAERLARHLNSRYADAAYVAGLMHDLGKPVLDLVAPDGYSKAMDMARAQGIFVLEAERRELGVDHTLAGKWLAEFWGLPEPYVAAIWLHHHPPGVLDQTPYPLDLVDIIALADALAHDHLAGHLEEGALRAICEERRLRLGLERNDLFHLVGESVQREQRQEPAAVSAPIPTPPQNESALEGLRAQRRFLRYRALHEMNVQLSDTTDRNAALHLIVETLRTVFCLPAGCCYVNDENGVAVDGVAWQEQTAPLQPFPSSEKGPSDAQRLDDGLAQIIESVLQKKPEQAENSARRGFMAVPLCAEEHTVGQVIFHAEQSGFKPQEEDMTDLLAFTSEAALVLMRCRRDRHQETQTEDLATALWKQELNHRQEIRNERLVSVAQLAAGAAHEINNPLAVISGRAQLLLTRATTPDEIRSLETIVQQTRRINKILNDLMQFARPAAPKLEPTLVSFVLHQVVSMLRDRLEDKGIKIVEHYAHGLPRVPLDRRQMEQVFLNLIVNAEQAMANRPGTLTLTVKPSRDRKTTLVQISDTGSGIPAEIMDRIFEPFFTTREAGESTGLGLAVCHGIIESHRGSITLHSEPGDGATCTITLPCAVETKSDPAVRESAPAKAAPVQATVLIADTDEVFREVMRETIQARGYGVRLAEDALETIAAIMGHPVDVILLDLRMPAVDSDSLLKELRQRFPAVPVIGVSMGNADEIDDALRMGAHACLRKPFEIDRILQEIARILGARHVA